MQWLETRSVIPRRTGRPRSREASSQNVGSAEQGPGDLEPPCFPSRWGIKRKRWVDVI